MTGLDAWFEAEGGLFLLECARVSGLIVTAPLAWLHAPMRIRASLVLVLSFVIHGNAAKSHVPASLIALVWAVFTEFALGAAIGLIVRFIVAMSEVAAEAIAPMLGLGVAQLFDSASHSNLNILSELLRYVSVLVALTLGVHRIVIEAVLAGFKVIPAGTISMPAVGLGVIWDMSGQVLLVGVRIALPLIAVLFIVQITLALVSRAAPQLQIFSVGFALATVVGLTTLVLIIPDLSRSFVVEYSRLSSHLERLFSEVRAAQ